MADVRPVKPGIYSKIVDVARTPDEAWVKIDVPASFDELSKIVEKWMNRNEAEGNCGN